MSTPDGAGDEAGSNPKNETFQAVLRRRLSRRNVLAGAALAASLVVVEKTIPGGILRNSRSLDVPSTVATPLEFSPVALSIEDKVTVPEGYEAQVLLRWGDPLFPGITGITPDIVGLNQTAALQEMRFGYNCDFLGFLPLPLGRKTPDHGLLWINHESTIEGLMFSSYSALSPDKSQVDVALAAHGASIVEIRRSASGRWGYVQDSRYNRRITGETMMEITGPAAGHDWLKVGYDATGTRVHGMLNNCGGGKTAWGTVITCEENFNLYFANSALPSDDPRRAVHARYGLSAGASERGWETVYSRFDVGAEPNEAFRFGWAVEVDPYDPGFTPKKRTALGRMHHEAATSVIANDGRVVVYTGDDQRFDYFYKFVSRGTYNPNDRNSNLVLLDSGTLYVAKLKDDGSGRWIPLVYGKNGLTSGNGFTSQAQVLINARGAADVVGATRMDRPEDIETNPVNGKVYAVMTNNTDRPSSQVDGPNPRAANRHGHIIELTEADNDAAATSFEWNIFMLCGIPGSGDGSFPGIDPGTATQISSPDNIAFDSSGILWIATDGQPNGLQMNDGIYGVPVEGDQRGQLRRLLSGPVGCEVTGLEFTADDTTLFVSIQHPGERGTVPDGSASRAFSSSSTWPDSNAPPRPSVVAIVKTSPGSRRIGS